jgi:hypothetical protein
MSHYRKIDVRIWNDEKFNALSDNGKLLFLFLLTHPNMTPLGGMRATTGGLGEELKWHKRTINKSFSELLNAKFVLYDNKNSLLIFRNFIKYNQPESPNVIKSWAYYLDLIPEGKLKTQLIQQTGIFVRDNLSEAFAKALPEAFAKGMLNQEQEHKQEHINNIYILDNAKESTVKPDEKEIEILLPTLRGSSKITNNQIEYWQKLFPTVNVIEQLQAMRNYILKNQQYTPASVGRFVTKWLSKENTEGAHDRTICGGIKNAGNTNTNTKRQSAFEQALELGAEYAGSIA